MYAPNCAVEGWLLAAGLRECESRFVQVFSVLTQFLHPRSRDHQLPWPLISSACPSNEENKNIKCTSDISIWAETTIFPSSVVIPFERRYTPWALFEIWVIQKSTGGVRWGSRQATQVPTPTWIRAAPTQIGKHDLNRAAPIWTAKINAQLTCCLSASKVACSPSRVAQVLLR